MRRSTLLIPTLLDWKFRLFWFTCLVCLLALAMKAVHVVPGLDDPTCGIAVAAKQLIARDVGEEGEVWVHSMWTPMVIKASFRALLTGKKLVRMPHGCTEPNKLKFHWHKKQWIAPIERWLFRQADRLIATCEEEVE